MGIKRWAIAALWVGLCGVGAVAAQDAKSADTTVNLIKLLVEQGVITPEKADALLLEAQTPPAGDTGVRVPYIPETLKKEIRDQVRSDVLTRAKSERWGDPGVLPDWMSRIRFDGDMRLRYQKDYFQDDNFLYGNIMEINRAGGDSFSANPYYNNTVDRARWRVRTRLGVTGKVTEDLSASLRLATGGSNDPVSTNQTLGDNNNKNTILLDRAYIKYEPRSWISMAGGKIPSPWFSTDLVWDEDLNFDGAAVVLKPQLSERTTGFLTLGGFPLQEVEVGKDKYLLGLQSGFAWSASRYAMKFAVAYYDYRNITGERNEFEKVDKDYTAPRFVQKGNSMFNIRNEVVVAGQEKQLYALAAEYKELNITQAHDFTLSERLHAVVTADYVENIGYDASEVAARTGSAGTERTRGYQLKLSLGTSEVKRRDDWQISYAYKRLEGDAVLDAFTDSDFHLGGTDAKGWIIGTNYGIAMNTWVGLRWLSSDAITDALYGIDTLQIDLNVRF